MRHGIKLNDYFNDEERQLLVPLIPLLVGTRTDRTSRLRRAHMLVDATIREITPMAYDALGWTDLATQLREIEPIKDAQSARSAHSIVIGVRDETHKRKAPATYDAAASADAIASAAAASDIDAYDDAADIAAAYAAHACIYAAHACSCADAAQLARRKIVEAAIAAFARAIAVT
jgi:hypothetical protein